MEKTNRRSSFKKLGLSVAALLGFGAAKAENKLNLNDNNKSVKKTNNIVMDKDVPLFSGSVVHGNTVFVAGKGAHFDGDIKAHTDHVLKELEKELVKQGSAMDQVLKVNVYLADLADYHKMNEVYRGRFGDKPPVRTTVATYGGVPGDSLVEIDCIAAL